jgi:hypothetical protein
MKVLVYNFATVDCNIDKRAKYVVSKAFIFCENVFGCFVVHRPTENLLRYRLFFLFSSSYIFAWLVIALTIIKLVLFLLLCVLGWLEWWWRWREGCRIFFLRIRRKAKVWHCGQALGHKSVINGKAFFLYAKSGDLLALLLR